MLLENKVALVTGSGRGIGRAIAIRLAQEGTNVAINFFRNRDSAEDTAAEVQSLGQQAVTIKANIGDIDALDDMFGTIEGEFGGLDILVCNAASGYNRPALEQKPKGWDWTMDVNARSLLFCAQRAAPLMAERGGGSIVSISSLGSFRVLDDYVVVGASKAAIEALTRYLAVELAPMDIVVNAIAPGFCETDAFKHFDDLTKDDFVPRVSAVTPAGRLITPEEIAGVVVFLCTPSAYMIRGQTIVADGGYSLPLPT